MSQSVADSFNRQSDAQNNLGQSQDEAARLQKKMALEAKIRARKGIKAVTADGFGSQSSAIAELQEKAKAEGKLISITREVDKGQHRVSLEERLRSRRAKVNNIKKTGGFMGFGKKVVKTGKNDLYKNQENTELFQDLEEAAIEFVNSKKIPDSWEGLLYNVFCVDKLTDMEKARVIFHYITAQNLDDLPGLPELETESYLNSVNIKVPGQALAGIKAYKLTYSELYAHMCEVAGLKCKIVSGRVKGSEWTPYVEFDSKFNSSWNAVKIDGQYRIVDCHWGSRHISTQNLDENENSKINYEYEEFYFFPEPDQIIATHFPNEEDQQFLENKKTDAEFNQACKKWPMFHKLGVKTSDSNSVIKTVNGKAVVEVTVQEEYRGLSQLVYTLASPNSQERTFLDKANYNEYVFHSKNVDGKNTFEINVPESGVYQLEICAYCPVFQKTAQYDSVCSFYIDCSESDEINQDDIRMFWGDFEMTKAFGKTADVERHNLQATALRGSSSYETVLKGAPGSEFKLDFDVWNVSNKFTWEVLDIPGDNTANEKLAKFVQIEYQQKKVQINVKLPNTFINEKNQEISKNGNYACLKLYTNEQNGEKLTMFAHYLLEIENTEGSDSISEEIITPYETSTTGIVQPEILLNCEIRKQIDQQLELFNVKLTSPEHTLSVLQLLKNGEVCQSADIIIEKDLKNAEYLCGLVFPANGKYSLLIAANGSTVVARYELTVSGVENFDYSPFPFERINANAIIDNNYSSYSQIDKPERVINNSIALNCKTGLINLTKSCGISGENFQPILLKVGQNGQVVRGNTGQIGIVQRESTFGYNDGAIELIFNEKAVYMLQLSDSRNKEEPVKKILFYVNEEGKNDENTEGYYEGSLKVKEFPLQSESWYRYRVQCAENKKEGYIMANLEKGKQIKLALKFKPNAVAGFNAKEDIQKLMIMIKSSSTPVMGRFECEDEQGEIWKCEVKVPQDGLTGQIVMVLKNGPRALLNYKCI